MMLSRWQKYRSRCCRPKRKGKRLLILILLLLKTNQLPRIQISIHPIYLEPKLRKWRRAVNQRRRTQTKSGSMIWSTRSPPDET